MYYLQGVDGEIGKGHDFTIFCNSKIFVVAVHPVSPPDDQITSILSRYNTAILMNDVEEEEKVQDEIDNMIYEVGWQTFAQLAPAIGSPRSLPDLHSQLNPESFYFRLVPAGGEVELVQESSPPPKCPFHLATSNMLNLPKYSARDIFVLEKFPGIGYIAKVSANGQETCRKIGNPTHGNPTHGNPTHGNPTHGQREYESLQKIALSKYACSIIVPQLIGLVVDDDEGAIGILEEFVPSEYTLGKIAGDAVAAGRDRRNKWAQQIKQTVYQLHEIGGSVWGWQGREYSHQF